jgi:hypothetical protein
MRFNILTVIFIALSTTVFANNDMTGSSSVGSANVLNATDRHNDAVCLSNPNLSRCRREKMLPKTRLAYFDSDQRLFGLSAFSKFNRPPRKFCKEYRWYPGCAPVLTELGLAGATSTVAMAGDECRYKDGGCIRTPFPPKKPKGPKTMVYTDQGQSLLGASFAAAAFQTSEQPAKKKKETKKDSKAKSEKLNIPIFDINNDLSWHTVILSAIPRFRRGGDASGGSGKPLKPYCNQQQPWTTPGACNGFMASAGASGDQCRYKEGGCIRPSLPPKKPKGPKTMLAYYGQDQTAPSRKRAGDRKWMTANPSIILQCRQRPWLPFCRGRVLTPKLHLAGTTSANAAMSGGQCRYKEGGCIRRPFPPTKPKLPKTKYAFYQKDQTRSAESKAVYTYGIRKRRRITVFQTVQNLLGTPEKTNGGCTTREMNKHLSRHLLRPRSSDAISLYTGNQLPPVVRKEKPPGPGNARKRTVCHRCTGGR